MSNFLAKRNDKKSQEVQARHEIGQTVRTLSSQQSREEAQKRQVMQELLRKLDRNNKR